MVLILSVTSVFSNVVGALFVFLRALCGERFFFFACTKKKQEKAPTGSCEFPARAPGLAQLQTGPDVKTKIFLPFFVSFVVKGY